jgi:DNA mismatch endonuclease, patch repair protein
MQAVKGSDTSLERLVDEEFTRRGWRYRRNVNGMPGKPDFVFDAAALVVFVDGDFWHGWRFPQWRSKLQPYWERKIERTRNRDRRNFQKLRRQGWRVIRIWGHQIEQDIEAAVSRVESLLQDDTGYNV